MSKAVKKWAKGLNRHLTKEDAQMPDAHMKRKKPHVIIWDLQIEVSYHCTHHSVQSPKQYQILVRIWSNKNSHSLLVRTQNGIATFDLFVTF